MLEKVKDIAVIGAGFMGYSIALLCAQNGIKTINIDISEIQINKAKIKVEKIMASLVEKEKMDISTTEKIKEILSYSTDYCDIKKAQIVIEAVPENIKLKKGVIRKIEEFAKKNTIILSNTSGLSITQIAESSKRPDKIMCAHFFSPPTIMKLVELIRGECTSDDTYEKTREFIKQIDKEAVISPELPGFIVNRLLIPMINEAAFLLMDGAKKEDIDNAMILGANHKMGPLELADFIGLDVVLAIMQNLHSGFKDDKYTPCPMIENLVKQGKLGKKTKIGFYEY